MSTELRIPEGIIVRTARGGPEILRGILSSLKQYSFVGYVKVLLKKESLSSVGYVVMEAGDPAMAIYQFEKKEPREMRRIYAGDKAMRFVWEDSQDRLSQIELHSRVPKEEFERRFPDAKLLETEELRSKISKQVVFRKVEGKKAEEPAEEEQEEQDPVLGEILRMRQDGYIVDDLLKLYKNDEAAAAKELPRYQENIEELVEIGRLLDSIPRAGLEQEIDRLKQELNDPGKLESIRIDIARFKEAARKRIERTRVAERGIEEDLRKKKEEEKSGDLYQMIMQYKEEKREAEGEEAELCEKCGEELAADGTCLKCSGAEEAGKAPQREDLTFDSFTVGANNKFAFAAAKAVADAPDKAYNPLYIYGKSGVGKTHLLNAIALKIAAGSPNSVAMMSAEKFTEDLERAMKANKVHAFRDGLRGKKALIIDDFQFLLGKEAAQGELLYLLDEIMNRGGQIVIASDRLPKEIPRLMESLATKIQGGLIADIQLPDNQVTTDILRKKAAGKGVEIPDEVLTFIEENIPDNVREMEAALNRLIAFATVMKVDVDLKLAEEMLKPALAAQEETTEAAPQVEIKPGHSYLVEEERPAGSIRLHVKKVDDGFSGLVISRLNPKQVRELFGAKGEILWLTDKESKTEATIAPSLEVIIHKVEESMPPGESLVLLIDGLQYLISNTSFESVLRFIRRLIDDFSESSSIMMISVSPGTLSTQEISILERELETVKLDL